MESIKLGNNNALALRNMSNIYLHDSHPHSGGMRASVGNGDLLEVIWQGLGFNGSTEA
jgi:hypothetical protein